MRIFILAFLFSLTALAGVPFGFWTTSGLVYQAEVLTYGTAITNNSGTISSNDFRAINTFVVSAKANGYWDYLLEVGPLAGNNTNAALIKLKYPVGVTNLLLQLGSASSYSATAGFVGDASTVYLNTRFGNTNFGTVSNGMTFFDTRTKATEIPAFNMLVGYQSAKFNLLSKDVSLNDSTWVMYSDTVAFGPGPVVGNKLGLGATTLTRTSSTNADMFHNGHWWGSSTSSGVDSGSGTVSVLAYGAGNGKGDATAGFYALDSGIPTNLVPTFHADLVALEYSLGRLPQFTNSIPSYLVIGQSRGTAGGGTANGGFVGSNTGTLFGNFMEAAISHLSLPASIFPTFKYAWTLTREGKDSVSKLNTGWKAFQDEMSWLSRTNGYGATNDSFMMAWGEGGQNYDYLSKPSTNLEIDEIGLGPRITNNHYGLSIRDVGIQQSNALAYFHQALQFRALLSAFGEADAPVVSIGTNMATWQTNYTTDIRAITGQTNDVPMFNTQQPSVTNQISNTNMLWLHQNFYPQHVLVGPVYFLKGCDGTHPTNFSYTVQGEYYAKAVFKAVIQNQRYDPLFVTNVSRSLSVITLTYTGVVGTLLLDNTNVTDPGNMGFQYSDSTLPPVITSVVVTATNQVAITLLSTPTGTGKTLSYAFPFTGMQNAQFHTNSPRGCLRDTDPTVGITSGSNLWNWAVHQIVAVP